MEFIKSCMADFILFGGLEGFIFCLFFEKIGECRKFKWYEWLVLSIGNCIISKTFPPMIYQIVMCFWMSFILYFTKKFNISLSIKYPFIWFFIMFIIEILYSILLEKTIKYDDFINPYFIISSILMVMFGTLTKIMPMWAIFLLCLYSCRDIYQKSPIELNNDFIGKDKDWHFKRSVLIMVLYLIAALVLYYFGIYEVCKCIMLSLIMVDLMLFKNDKEYI